MPIQRRIDGRERVDEKSDGSYTQLVQIEENSLAGNISAITNVSGTGYTAFASQACKMLTVSNQTGTALEFRQGATGVAFQVPTGSVYTFRAITNANQIDVRRVDVAVTQVTVTARWES